MFPPQVVPPSCKVCRGQGAQEMTMCARCHGFVHANCDRRYLGGVQQSAMYHCPECRASVQAAQAGNNREHNAALVTQYEEQLRRAMPTMRPRAAYTIFTNDMQKVYRDQGVVLQGVAVEQIFTQAWSQLGPNELTAYEAKSKQELLVFQTQLQQYQTWFQDYLRMCNQAGRQPNPNLTPNAIMAAAGLSSRQTAVQQQQQAGPSGLQQPGMMMGGQGAPMPGQYAAPGQYQQAPMPPQPQPHQQQQYVQPQHQQQYQQYQQGGGGGGGGGSSGSLSRKRSANDEWVGYGGGEYEYDDDEEEEDDGMRLDDDDDMYMPGGKKSKSKGKAKARPAKNPAVPAWNGAPVRPKNRPKSAAEQQQGVLTGANVYLDDTPWFPANNTAAHKGRPRGRPPLAGRPAAPVHNVAQVQRRPAPPPPAYAPAAGGCDGGVGAVLVPEAAGGAGDGGARQGYPVASGVQDLPPEIIVGCCGIRGRFIIPDVKVICQCTKCTRDVPQGRDFHPTHWEQHCGAGAAKKWKASIKIEAGAVPEVPPNTAPMPIGRYFDIKGVDVRPARTLGGPPTLEFTGSSLIRERSARAAHAQLALDMGGEGLPREVGTARRATLAQRQEQRAAWTSNAYSTRPRPGGAGQLMYQPVFIPDWPPWEDVKRGNYMPIKLGSTMAGKLVSTRSPASVVPVTSATARWMLYSAGHAPQPLEALLLTRL